MSQLQENIIKQAAEAAIEAKFRSYSPYSNFPVGCSLVCHPGDIIITGNNVENSSIGLTICAEKAAICSAINRGYKTFKAVFVCTNHMNVDVWPCGGCRQFISEFSDDCDIYCVKSDGEIMAKRNIKELLPAMFQAAHLNY